MRSPCLPMALTERCEAWSRSPQRARRCPVVSARLEHTRVNWDSIDEFPQPPLPEHHPWPSRDIFTYKVLGIPLRCEHLAISMGHFKPGESLEHHGHREAEEVYILMQ